MDHLFSCHTLQVHLSIYHEPSLWTVTWAQGPDTKCCWGGYWLPSLTGVLLLSAYLLLFLHVFHVKITKRPHLFEKLTYFLPAGAVTAIFVYLGSISPLWCQEHSGQQLWNRNPFIHQRPKPQAPRQQSTACSKMWVYAFLHLCVLGESMESVNPRHCAHMQWGK